MHTDNVLASVAGMVTLYNSDLRVVDHVRTYVEQVGKLYIIDNSERPDDRLVADLRAISPRIEYIQNEGNLGLGVALNRAAQRAISETFTHLLMMDDDSSMPEGAVEQLYQTIESDSARRVGIVSAAQTDAAARNHAAPVSADPPSVVLTAITAGSLLNLTAYQQAGPFQDDLFIDWVDIEYSFRLKRYGYQLWVDHRVRMMHRIGIRKQVKLLGFIPYRWRSHSPVRLYYKFRNSLFVMKREGENIPPDFRRRFRRELRRNIIRILLAEPNKREFFALIRRAIADARAGRLGKLNQESSPPSTEKIRSDS